MHNFEMSRLPSGLNWLFQRVENVHNRLTRLSSARGRHTHKFDTTTYGLSSLRYSETKALNTLKNEPLFNNATSKKHLNRLFSNAIFDSY